MKTIQNRTDELRQIAAQTKEELQVIHCDFENKADVKAFEKHIETVFKNRIALIKSYENQGEGADAFTYECVNRRINAVRNAAQSADGLYRKKYPKLSVAHAFTELCAPCPSDSFNGLDRIYHIELAAAIWLLDFLRGSNKLDEALAFLPESREELDRVTMPNVTDSVHCDDLLRGMLYVIRYRNLGISGFDEEKPLLDAADAALQGDGSAEPTVGRNRFASILSLVEEDTINALTDAFRAQIGELTEDLLDVLSVLKAKKAELAQTKIKMIEEEIQRIAQTLPTDDGLPVHRNETPPSDGIGFETTYTAADDARVEAFQTEEELQKAEYQLRTFCLSVLWLASDKQQEIRDLIGEELFGKIRKPSVSDPFGFCFAFLYLLYRNSDEIWLYNLPYVVLENACRELPWAGTSAARKNNPEFTTELVEAAKLHPEEYITPPSQTILNRHIVKHPFVDPNRDTISFSQLVYIMSGLVPPRGLPELSYMKSLFSDSGLPQTEVEILYDYLSLAYLMAQRDENYVFVDEEETEAPEAEEQEADARAEEQRELKRENKKLKALINKLEHRLRESGEALKNADESLNEASAELAELRSMIRQPEKEQVDYTTTITFPYEAQKRTVVFGGHSSWLKAIRPLLPNVRFIEPSAQPNTGLILNADVVWIQTNALSHSSFYKIIDLVRKNNIELHYFKYASAEKCAEQLALEEAKNAEEQQTEES